MKPEDKEYLPLKTIGDWTLCGRAMVYRVRRCARGYFQHKITRVDCGQVVRLYEHLYDNEGNLLPPDKRWRDEDVYEWVHEDGNIT